MLPVIDVNSRLKQLTPGKVDFDFDQDIEARTMRSSSSARVCR